MAKAKQTTQEVAVIVAAEKLQAGEQPGAAPAAAPTTTVAVFTQPVVGDAVQVVPPSDPDGPLLQSVTTQSERLGGVEAIAALRDQLAPPAPVRHELFKAVSNVLIDGEGAEAGSPIWLTEKQFDHLKPLGAIEGEWPD